MRCAHPFGHSKGTTLQVWKKCSKRHSTQTGCWIGILIVAKTKTLYGHTSTLSKKVAGAMYFEVLWQVARRHVIFKEDSRWNLRNVLRWGEQPRPFWRQQKWIWKQKARWSTSFKSKQTFISCLQVQRCWSLVERIPNSASIILRKTMIRMIAMEWAENLGSDVTPKVRKEPSTIIH